MKKKRFICSTCGTATVYGKDGGTCGYCGGKLILWDGKPISKETLITKTLIKENNQNFNN